MLSTKCIIGTSGWIYSDWRGAFYPNHLKQSEWLDYYQKYFSVVEINATFYRRFADEIYCRWRNNARSHFHYIIKVPRYISHVKLLKNCRPHIKRFCRSAALLKKKLALILLQLPPRMPYDLARLEKAISAFDDPRKVVVEFRNEKWLTDEVKKLLIKWGCIFCITDSPITPPLAWVTSSIAYIRLHGRTEWYNYNYTYHELISMTRLITKLKQQGAKKIYILFNNDYYTYAIKNAITLKKLLSK